VKKVLLFCYRW